MKMIIVALALVAVAAAASVPGEPVQILRSEFNQNPDGGYNFDFASDDNTKRSETGEVKEVLDEEKKPHSVIVVRGSYTYTDPEGNEETINYTADESGYHPEGKSIPQVPSRR